eukprot:scaffold44388_cov63-Phaeocystis_antarctica.AAC.3
MRSALYCTIPACASSELYYMPHLYTPVVAASLAHPAVAGDRPYPSGHTLAACTMQTHCRRTT